MKRRPTTLPEPSSKLHWRRGWGGRGQDRRVDLFDLFTGALAVQESLQLDTMRGRRPGELSEQQPGVEAPVGKQPLNDRDSTVKVSDLVGPKVESHPWGKMLAVQQVAGKKPEIGPLDLCVPEDQYYITFRSLTKLLEGVDAGDVWGSHLYNQAAKCAKTQRDGRPPQGATGHADRPAHAPVLRHGR